MENNKTAVEWLVDQMFKQGYFDGNKPLTFTNLDHLQQKAKEMEKEQIIKAHGNKKRMTPTVGNYLETYTGEQYYKETYK